MKETQRERILEALKEGKLNSYYATYQMRIKQAPTRIKELREDGFNIVSTTNKDRSVDWELVSIPDKYRSYRMEVDPSTNLARKIYL
jgi:hypothetical protein